MFALVAASIGCSSSAPSSIEPPPPDPCVAARAEIEAARALHACTANTDCELARGVLPPGVTPSEGPRRYGLEGTGPVGVPCGTAIHREDAAALEVALSRFEALSCGPVSEPGSTRCMSTSHGPHPTCLQGRCVLAM